MQRSVNSLTESIFPGVHLFNTEEQRRRGGGGRRETTFKVTSDLRLQMALYFNVFFFPFWLVVSVLMLHIKFDQLHPLYRIILVAVLVVISVVEVVRLYLGYLGNLSEMIPELAGFWLLTLLLQFPLQLFLLANRGTVILPLERAMNIVMTLFIVFELVVGYGAIKQVSAQLAHKFQMEAFDLTESLPLTSTTTTTTTENCRD